MSVLGSTVVDRVTSWTRLPFRVCGDCTSMKAEIRRLKRENGILAEDNGRLARELATARRAA